jgi:hypothetical protein
MPASLKPQAQRFVNLIKAVRDSVALLPGDRIEVSGEKPATYIGAIEMGDIQVDYLQLHAFRLWDGIHVILAAPSLNRSLGKLLY